MWIRDIDTGKWSIYQDQLSKDKYDSLKQDLESIKFYSKCLSGATYLLINKFDNIYETLSYKDSNTWYISGAASPYSTTIMPFSNPVPIDKLTIDEFFNKYTKDYGFTLKTLFTPYKLINEAAENFIEVDVATVAVDVSNADITGLQTNLDLTSNLINLTIDGVKLLEGHKVLIKDQITFVELPTFVDPETYFKGNYYVQSTTTTSITYYYFNEENGIYEFTNNSLVRTANLDDYDSSYNLSVSVKLGETNRDQQFHLSRLKTGYYPTTSENDPIEFTSKHNWILRNRVDYNNVLDINYYDVLKHATQSYFDGSYTYSIPQRTVAVGEFGVIMNNQDRFSGQTYSFSHIINNRFKINLRGVDQTSGYYWICGDEGTLLKVSKVDFSITKIELNELRDFRSVSFYNDTRGVVVGRFNTVYFTNDGGYNWLAIEFPEYEEFSYNRVLFANLNSFYVAGENGVFIEFSNVGNDWISYQRKIFRTVTKNDVYPLVEDLYELVKVDLTGWNLTYSTTASTNTISTNKEGILISGANSTLIVYDYSNFVSEHDFLYLTWNVGVGDIRSLAKREGTQEIYLASDSIYKFNLNDFEEVDTISNDIVAKTFISERSQVIGTAYDPLNLGQWQQVSLTASNVIYGEQVLSGLPPYSGANPRDWSTTTPIWSTPQFTVSPFALSGSSWTKAIATSSNIQAGNTITFYAPISYFGGNYKTTTTHLNYLLQNPNYFTNMIGYLDRLWLIGQRLDGTWELIQECKQSLGDDGVPLYSLRNYRFENDYKSIGFIVNQESAAVKAARGRVGIIPDFPFYMGEIIEFTISNDRPTIFANYYANKLVDFQGQEQVVIGNKSLLKFGDYVTSEFVEFDPTISSKLKSKMLFLDYDVASKLNFFEDNGDYRLPNSISFSGLTSTNTSFAISNLTSEYNWLNYYRDAEKTFAYYSSFSDANRVEFSTTFSYHSTGTSSFTFSKTNLSISLSDIQVFAPTIASPTQSRYVAGTTPLPTSTVSTPYSVLLYKYLGVFRVSSTDPYSVGDVLLFDSDVVTTTLVVNRIINTGGVRYLYVYTDFNESILNSLKKSNSLVTITNLNKYKDINQLVDRFENHPISLGYKLEQSGVNFELSCRFNNKTAYYNMQTKVVTTSLTYEMVYQDSFLKFGFSPTYNLLDYLSNIDAGFTASKTFFSMPQYSNIPGNGTSGFLPSNIYIDTNVYKGVTGSKTNQLLFGSDLKFEWQSIWLHTFVDIVLYTNTGTYSSDCLLVVDKYYDQTLDGYVIAFDRALNYATSDDLLSVTINSRNTLAQISEDLQILNNMQRKTYTKSIQPSNSFTNFENRLDSKFTTDAYCKILLSDSLIKDKLSAIIYTDYKYQLVMNVVNLERQFKSNIVNTTSSSGYLQITTDTPHNLNSGDGVVLVFNGGTFSSQVYNPQYNGFQTIEYLDDYNFRTTVLYGVSPPGADTGYVEFVRRDAFFNYQPTDINDLGVNKIAKVAVEITPNNVQLVDRQFNLINLDMSKYKYELYDGLSVEELINNYHWILEAEISDAKIGKVNSEIVWYSGIWKCGRWFGGTWISGTWVGGDWYDGIWNALLTKNKVINIEVGNQQIESLSKWYGGRWFDGTWNSGKWYSGRRYAGDWFGGSWFNGIWNDGNWYDGVFSGGIWVLGNWKKGIFNSDSKPSYWLDGIWSGGDFENGRWFDGEFSSKDGVASRFGTKASNSRNAIWESGNWLSGNFYSLLNKDDNGNEIASDIHKFSLFKTGIWNQGNFYGGITYNIDFRGGNFFGGIVDDIQIIGVIGSSNTIILNGIFRFNIGDEIWITEDADIPNKFPALGTIENPKKYKIAFITIDSETQSTQLRLLYDFNSLGIVSSQSGGDLGLRVVSNFANTTWYSGLWYNGIFQNGTFLGGMWYNGVFDGDWGQ